MYGLERRRKVSGGDMRGPEDRGPAKFSFFVVGSNGGVSIHGGIFFL